ARLLPLGNLIFRASGAFIALFLVTTIHLPLDRFSSVPAQQIVSVHILFNLFLVIGCLPLTGLVARLAEKLMPASDQESSADEGAMQSALDQRVVHVPRLALASATRELLRMGELVEVMARPVMMMLENGNQQEIKRLQKMDESVNKIHSEIKLYIAEVNRGELTSEDAERSMELASFAINLERAGDLISKNLLERAIELHENKVSFSREGQVELENMHDRVMANMQLALNVLVSGDVASARELIAEKDRMRQLERECHDRHLDRLKSRTPESIDSSNVHMEVVRSLKEINSLFATVAVPILAQEGQLRDSRLVPAE
ncbi:MAG: Na/Pi cotransporter family protein, partial [Roseibium sp.]|uniref:Na/Pi cotransporter family protein n=1 Tax=Roseibium sp. TaxID=1936156 RepID=UPI00261F3981